MPYTWNRIILFVALLGMLCIPARAQMSTELWQTDIKVLAQNLPAKHPNFYTKHTAQEFEEAFDALSEQVPMLDDSQIVMELNRLVAMGNDAHTNIEFSAYAKSMHRLPIQIIVLSDGVFITGATSAYKELVGAQIIKFGDTDALEAFEQIGVLFGYENNSRLINAGSSYLPLLPAMAAVGIADDFGADTFNLTIKDDSGERVIELDCTIPTSRPQWVSFAQGFKNGMPLMYRKSHGNYQTEFLKDSGAMYLAYNQCKDAKDYPMKLLSTFITEKSDEFDARRLVIDLRFNGGGDETVLWALMEQLESFDRFKDKGDIVVLISRYTFSSAMSNAHQLKDRLGAILIGEPTGGKPNHFGELNSFILPNSKLTISHSTKWFEKVEGDPDAVHPDVLIEVGSADFFAGKDPVLEAALNYEAE